MLDSNWSGKNIHISDDYTATTTNYHDEFIIKGKVPTAYHEVIESVGFDSLSFRFIFTPKSIRSLSLYTFSWGGHPSGSGCLWC